MERTTPGTLTIGQPKRFVTDHEPIALAALRLECERIGIIHPQVSVPGETTVTGSSIEGDERGIFRDIVRLYPQDNPLRICQCQCGDRQLAGTQQRILDLIDTASGSVDRLHIFCIVQPEALPSGEDPQLDVTTHVRHKESKFRQVAGFDPECRIGSVECPVKLPVTVHDHEILSFGSISQFPFLVMPGAHRLSLHRNSNDKQQQQRNKRSHKHQYFNGLSGTTTRFSLPGSMNNQGMGARPSHCTFHFPFFGKPGVFFSLPSQPAHIMATAVSSPPLPGR